MGAQWKAKGKELAANAKGRLFSKLAKDIMLAARSGADPAGNAKLRLVMEQARKVSMPKDTLDRAIKKGAGLTGESVHFDHVIYEGFAPHRVPVMVECLTDNVNRTAPEMRVLFRKGQLGTSGSVSWDFDHVGMVEAEPAAAGADPELAAIEAGAQDFEPGQEEGSTLFLTDPGDLDLVSRALPAQGFTVLSAKLRDLDGLEWRLHRVDAVVHTLQPRVGETQHRARRQRRGHGAEQLHAVRPPDLHQVLVAVTGIQRRRRQRDAATQRMRHLLQVVVEHLVGLAQRAAPGGAGQHGGGQHDDGHHVAQQPAAQGVPAAGERAHRVGRPGAARLARHALGIR